MVNLLIICLFVFMIFTAIVVFLISEQISVLIEQNEKILEQVTGKTDTDRSDQQTNK